MAKREVFWTKASVRQFRAAIEYIRKDSGQQADFIKNKILEKISLLSSNVVAHRRDPLKKDNSGRFLYFEMLKYRIVYYSDENKVIILRIRHTSREPRKY